MHDAQFLDCIEAIEHCAAAAAIVQNTFAHKEKEDHLPYDFVDTFVADVVGETFAPVAFAEEIFAVPALFSASPVVVA